MKKTPQSIFATAVFCVLMGNAQAGMLHAQIVEENKGPIGQVSWTILNEKGFVPVSKGVGKHIKVKLNPGRYVVSVDGDTQGREAVEIGHSSKSIKIVTRKFY